MAVLIGNDSQPEKTRLVYSQSFAGKTLDPAESKLIVELIARTSGRQVDDLPEAILSFERRSQQSSGMLMFLIPQGEETVDFLVERGHRKPGAVLLGCGFFGNTTGILHDLAFDYELIDSLFSPSDRRADEHLLDMLLEVHGERMVFAMAESSDARRLKLLSSAGLEPQQTVGNGVLYGRRIEGLFADEGDGDSPSAPDGGAVEARADL